MSDLDTESTATPPHAPDSRDVPDSAPSIALFALVVVLVGLGDVLAFNQLATQSPTDALLQLLVFSIGFAGIVEAARRLLFPTSTSSRFSAITPGILGVAAVIAWRAETPIGASLTIAALATAASGVLVYRLLWGASRTRRDHAEIIGLLWFAQTMTFGYLTVLAALDAGPTLFG